MTSLSQHTHLKFEICPKTNPRLTIVVRLEGITRTNISSFFREAADLVKEGHELVVVHELLGENKVKNGISGFPKHIDEFERDVNKVANTYLVSSFQKVGVNALGVSGLDGQLIKTEQKDQILFPKNGNGKRGLGDTLGEINQVNMGLLCLLLVCGCTPVIAPIAINENGQTIFVNADQAIDHIAVALSADVVIVVKPDPDTMFESEGDMFVSTICPETQWRWQ